MSRDDIDRREFLASAAAGMAFTIVPRHVLGGPGHTAPSDKLTLAYIGCGTQGIREMLRLLPLPDVQITAVCDPVKDGTNYVDWDKTGIRDSVREAPADPRAGEPESPASAPGGTWRRRSSRPSTRSSGSRGASRASPATPTSGSFSRRRRTSTPSRS